ncbi:hypothetical protein 20Sep420_00103 [Pseudomonas phage 20Sep420]|nr:hypothetical protein 20Sep420_00103 [Pseudomonas phage 20Sep420]
MRKVCLVVTDTQIVALAAAVAAATAQYAASARCSSCSQPDRDRLKARSESLRKLYEDLTSEESS